MPSWCKQCMKVAISKSQKKLYLSNKQRATIDIPAEKFCGRCDIIKPSVEFGRRANRSDGLFVWCKACCASWAKSKRDGNRQLAREIDRNFKQKHKRRLRLRSKEQYVKHIGRIRNHYINNKDRYKANSSRRRARLINAEGHHNASEIRIIYHNQSKTCVYCSERITLKSFHADHKTPLSRGGSNWPSNIQLLCAGCNLSKGTKTHDEYILYRAAAL